MSFENDKYSVGKDPYEWFLKQSNRLKAIGYHMKIQMRNKKSLKKLPGELEHEVKCRCNQSCTLDDIANTLKDVRKRKNIGKYFPYKDNSFREKNPFKADNKDKPREKVAEMTKKKNACQNCGSTDSYGNNCPNAKKKVYAIEQVLEEEIQEEDSEYEFMGDSIRENSDDDQDPIEEFLVEYQEETQLGIQDIHMKAGLQQDSSNKILCKQTKDAQTFLATQTKGMAYINGKSTKITVFFDNYQHALIIRSGVHCSIVAREYLDKHFPN
ncbi:hypothetical protein O181_034800 [Austropuccinia psidii MF-1]|uniref:Uncharacterized protein n=1 Tax=Austropuccinia psidii MF-1 TaxID=1389203 RepID=A0A9Q3HAL0_9BASI|nr:hypothetical protein [Austropuccinia psidii MF-1]